MPSSFGRDDELVVDLVAARAGRDRVALDPPLGDPERVQHVERLDRDVELAIDRHVQLVGPQSVRLGVLERPFELLRGHAERHAVVGLGLDVVEHDPRVDAAEEDDDRRDHRPGDLELGVAVNRLTVGLVAGLGAVLPHRVAEHRHHDREDEARDHDHDVEQVVDRLALHRRRRSVPLELQHHDGAHDRDREHHAEEAN